MSGISGNEGIEDDDGCGRDNKGIFDGLIERMGVEVKIDKKRREGEDEKWGWKDIFEMEVVDGEKDGNDGGDEIGEDGGVGEGRIVGVMEFDGNGGKEIEKDGGGIEKD